MSTPPLPSFTKTWHSEPYAAIDPTRPELSQQGKTVVVTGAGGSIGSAMAKAFALAGASKIALIGRTESTLNKTKEAIENNTTNPVNILVVTADITNESSITSAFSTIASTFGSKIDIFISNAGALNTPTPVSSVDIAEWTSVLNTNVFGTLFTARAFLRHASADAFLLHVSSAVAHFPPITGFSGYAASKLAATKILDYVAWENKGMRLVHLQPGSVGSDMGSRSGMPAMDSRTYSSQYLILD